MHKSSIVGAVASLAISLAVAPFAAKAAQPEPPRQQPVSADPQTTTASFGDWVVRCSKTPEPNPQRVCEVAQSLILRGQSAPIAQIAIGRLDKERMLTVLLPVEIAFAKQPTVSADDAHALALSFKRCVPAGCFADAVLDPATIKEMREATKPGRLSFLDATGRPITLPLSFRGLPQALDQWAKEER